jgi:uncharacterized protein
VVQDCWAVRTGIDNGSKSLIRVPACAFAGVRESKMRGGAGPTCLSLALFLVAAIAGCSRPQPTPKARFTEHPASSAKFQQKPLRGVLIRSGERLNAKVAVKAPGASAKGLAPAAGLKPEVIRLVSRQPNGTGTRVVADLLRAFEGDPLKLQPIERVGAMQILEDLMHRPGIDAAIVQTDAMEGLIQKNAGADPREHIRFIAGVYDEDVHLLSRRDIADVRELDGRRVNISTRGSGAHLTAKLIFDKLYVKPKFTTYEDGNALARLRTGEIDAVLLLAGRPTWEVLSLDPEGFRLLPIPWNYALKETYKYASLGAGDYPNLIAAGERVDTVSVSNVLAVYNWPRKTKGYSKTARFTKAFFACLTELRKPGHHFDWQLVEGTISARGWKRFQLAHLLDRQANGEFRQGKQPRVRNPSNGGAR